MCNECLMINVSIKCKDVHLLFKTMADWTGSWRRNKFTFVCRFDTFPFAKMTPVSRHMLKETLIVVNKMKIRKTCGRNVICVD